MSSSRQKRQRDGDDNEGMNSEEPPRIRIKTEEELGEKESEYVEDPFMNGGPPTPPLPRSQQEQNEPLETTVPRVVVKQEVAVDPEPKPDPLPCSSRQALAEEERQRNEKRSSAGPNVKKESNGGGGGNSTSTSTPSKPSQGQNVEENWDEDEGPKVNGTKEASGPNISSFFRFSSEPVVEATLPNVMAPEVKTDPDTGGERREDVNAYYNIRPENEQQYGITGIPMIPVYRKKKAGGDSADNSEDEVDDNDMNNLLDEVIPGTRYFERKKIYEKYDFDSRTVDTSRLAVFEKRQHILASLEKSRVVIIEGFTGCGKTTQVPQFILDKCRADKIPCNIAVTQPRKIAAISVARRVCDERNWNLGSIVGYQVGMDAKLDRKDTLLTFMTTGVLLQKLIGQKSLKEFSHIIIDEVHERDLESDFLLLVIRKIMSQDTEGKDQHVKLILMSATIETKRFEEYFAFQTPEGDILKPHVVKIPLVRRHTVEEIFLDQMLTSEPDLLNQIESNLDRDKAAIQDDLYDLAVRCITKLDESERANHPDPRQRRKTEGVQVLLKDRGAVLVFLPGMEEIKRMQRTLNNAEQDKVHNDQFSFCWNIIPLHSSVTKEDQDRVFERSKPSERKIILSTNIAESSVTVPDVHYVIDFCLSKSLCIDKTTNFTTLRMIWASQSQCVQRKGRTGRVAEGKVYRLVPKCFYDTLDKEIVPEMKRSNLETIILQCKKFELDSPLNLLSEALDRPDLSGIQRATATLKELGALTIESRDPVTGQPFYDPCDGDLTFVGRVMTELPIPQQCTRLILLGHCFGVMQEAIIIAAGVSVKSPFQCGFRKQMDMYLKKMQHARKSFSDLFALYYVYKEWDVHFGEGRRRNRAEQMWAKANEVKLSALREIKDVINTIDERLKRLGIAESYVLPSRPKDPNTIELTGEQGIFLKMAIAGAFYPRYFIRRRPDMRQYQKDLQRDVNGADVFRSIYFKGFPHHHIGKLYAKHVADYLSYGTNVPTVKFEGQKVIAIFDNSTGDTIGPINKGLFRAIKLRQLRSDPLEFNVLRPEEEERELQKWESWRNSRRCTPCPELRELPPLTIDKVKVKVQHINSPSQFWVILGTSITKMDEVSGIIDANFRHDLLPDRKLLPNTFCLAPYGPEKIYYRAKILRIQPSDGNGAPQALVYFVDYGNSELVSTSVLCDFSPRMYEAGIHKVPCMGVECRLKELKPNIVYGLHWSEESISLMRRFCDRAPGLEFEIYSIHESIMIGDLIGVQPDQARFSLIELLTQTNENKKLYGEPTEEPFFSKENHRKRLEMARLMDRNELRAAQEEQKGDPIDFDFMEPPKHARTPVLLKGPWSPLEIDFHALVNCSNTKTVRIENNSVNSVLLDHEPTESNSRLLVAAHVSVVERSQAVMARECTVMSAIPGITSLVCMLFCPKAELRYNSRMTKYTGLLCGCGVIPGTNSQVHPDNDMEIVFDTVIDDDDIDNINLIRNQISMILRTGRGVNKGEIHKTLRNKMLSLLKRKRARIDEEVWPQEEYVWNRTNPDFLQPIGMGLSFNHEDIFQPHRKIRLNVDIEEEVEWGEDIAY